MPSALIDQTAFDDPERDVKLLTEAGIEAQTGVIGASPDTRVAGLLLGDTVIDDAVAEKYPNLRAISRYGTGTDNIQIRWHDRGIVVRNVDGYGTTTVASHALGLIIAANRYLLEMETVVQRSLRWQRPLFPIPDLADMTLGIIGYGRIGSTLGTMASTIFRRIVMYDPYVFSHPPYVDRMSTLGDLLNAASVISLHVPLTTETHMMIDSQALTLLGRDGVVVNTARGGVVDVETLANALSEGSLRAAGLDVLPNEPPRPDDAILKAPRVVLTPHVAWQSISSERRMRDGAVQNLVDSLEENCG